MKLKEIDSEICPKLHCYLTGTGPESLFSDSNADVPFCFTTVLGIVVWITQN